MTTVQASPGNRARRIRRVLLAFAALAVLATPLLVDAQGAGTAWMKCRDQAWIDMGVCYYNATSWMSQMKCNIAFDLDLWGCNAELIHALSPLF